MLIALIKALRPKQWLKNGLLFAGVIFDRQLTNFPALFKSLAGFVVFSLIASTVYLINDLSDIEADRQHPRKRNRPIASGALPTSVAKIAVVVLFLVAFPAAYFLSVKFFIVCVIYFALNLSYSTWLKHIPLIDVLALASFYVLRIAAGVNIIVVENFSPWLYLTSTFGALYLGIGKRRAELVAKEKSGQATRKVLDSYTLPYLDQLITIVLTITILSYSLYTFSAPNLPENHVMMLTIPFVIYGVFRYLYLVQVEGVGEAPEDIAISDRPLQITVVLWGLSILAIFYIT
ncbi:MAG: decaprenyl-phosphate phosphoribosyltransferase [Anaerolineales bacterium]|nr:decaprenyl-phosphate phosphoribosyltransferase [Anaerolineales bacterium]